jgi:hypothetical protein
MVGNLKPKFEFVGNVRVPEGVGLFWMDVKLGAFDWPARWSKAWQEFLREKEEWDLQAPPPSMSDNMGDLPLRLKKISSTR